MRKVSVINVVITNRLFTIDRCLLFASNNQSGRTVNIYHEAINFRKWMFMLYEGIHMKVN